ncbi:MAG: glutathione transferase GstA [bacterium]|nr:glutathione transferase GstA [bacterium]
MKLYYSKGACSLVVRIILNELNFKSEFESVDLKTKKTEKGGDFLEINPKGAVPTIELENGKILTENAVILQYLADMSESQKVLPPMGDFERYKVLEWVNYITTEIHKSFANLFNQAISDEIKRTLFIPIIKSKFAYINNALEHKKYLAGDHFTLPDAYLYVMTRWAINFKIDFSVWSNLAHYINELENRGSIQKSLTEEGLSNKV